MSRVVSGMVPYLRGTWCPYRQIYSYQLNKKTDNAVQRGYTFNILHLVRRGWGTLPKKPSSICSWHGIKYQVIRVYIFFYKICLWCIVGRNLQHCLTLSGCVVKVHARERNNCILYIYFYKNKVYVHNIYYCLALEDLVVVPVFTKL